jgi:methionine synthase II (cobalamin-independent)
MNFCLCHPYVVYNSILRNDDDDDGDFVLMILNTVAAIVANSIEISMHICAFISSSAYEILQQQYIMHRNESFNDINTKQHHSNRA